MDKEEILSILVVGVVALFLSVMIVHGGGIINHISPLHHPHQGRR